MFTHRPSSVQKCTSSHTRNAQLTCAFALCAFGTINHAQATIVDTGNVQEIDGSLVIGTSAYGKREVTDEAASYVDTQLGNIAGITGELFLTNTQYTSTGEVAVGVSGNGLLNLPRDNTVQTNLLSVGKNVGSTGSVAIGPSIIDLGITGRTVLGDAGTGSLSMDGQQFSETMYGARIIANQFVLGAQAGGTGSFNPGCESFITLGGESPKLIVGDYGTGNMTLGRGDDSCSIRLDMTVIAPGSSQIVVARNPGSQGTLTFWGNWLLTNVDTLLIGLDELDQPGGTGTVEVRANQNMPVDVTVGEARIGPQGVLGIYSAPGPYFTDATAAILSSNVYNWGTVRANLGASINGNLENNGQLVGDRVGIFTCGISEEPFRVNGNLTQTGAGQQNVSIDTISDYCIETIVTGGLIVQGTAQYNGTLNVMFADGSQLVVGDQFNALSVPAGTATYDPAFAVNFDTSGLPAQLDAVADVSPTGIVIRIVQKSGTYADLALGIADTPDPALVGQDVTYTISVVNNGPSPATGVTVSGSLPTCSLGDIAAGATASCTRTVTASTAGSLTQTVSVGGNEQDPNTGNNSASVSTTVNPAIAADLALSMTASPDPVRKNAKLVYTLTVTNTGPDTASNVSLVDTLPSNVRIVEVVASQGACNGTSTITCALGSLGSGGQITVAITIKPMTLGTITNVANVTAAENDPDTTDNSASTATPVVRK